MPDREFIDILTDLDDGNVNIQLTKLLPEVVRAVMETQKSGSLTLTLNVKPEKRMAVVKADIKTKIPAPANEATIFFTTEEGDLRRDDPRQQVLRNVLATPAPERAYKAVPAAEKPTEEKE